MKAREKGNKCFVLIDCLSIPTITDVLSLVPRRLEDSSVIAASAIGGLVADFTS